MQPKYAKNRVDNWEDKENHLIEVALALKNREDAGYTLANEEAEFLQYVMSTINEAAEHLGLAD